MRRLYPLLNGRRSGRLNLGASGYTVSSEESVYALDFESRDEALRFLDQRVGPSDVREITRLGWVHANLSNHRALDELAQAIVDGELHVTGRESFMLGPGPSDVEDRSALVEAEPLAQRRIEELVRCRLEVLVPWSPIVLDLHVEVPTP